MLATKLRFLRTEKGITQETVAKTLGVSSQAISKWEQGTTSPDISLLVPIADYFNVSLDYLLRDTTDPKLIAPEKAVEIRIEPNKTRWIVHIKNITNHEIKILDLKAYFYNEEDNVIDYSNLFVDNLEPGMSIPQHLITSMSNCVKYVRVVPKKCIFRY